jgi:hypothetical protein
MQRGRPAWLPADIHRIAVFRALQVGDLLCAVPALRALRSAFPAARITLIGLPWASQFAQRFAACVDDFIAFPGHPSLPEPAADMHGYAAFVERVRALQCDLAIQLHGSGGLSNPVVQYFGARLTTGFTCRPQRDGPTFFPYPERGHEAARWLSLVALLGGEDGDGNAALEFPVLEADEAELQATGLPALLADRRYACLHAGARDPARRWAIDGFAAVGDALAARGLAVVLTGSAAEQPLAASVAARMRYPALNAALPWSLGAMAALMQRARLLVCNDTGVSHIAAGLQLPSVVVFPRDDAAHRERWAPMDCVRHRWVVAADDRAADAVLRASLGLLQTAAG